MNFKHNNISVSILKAASFHQDEGQAAAVRPLRAHAEDVFLRRQTENMLDSLQLFHEDFSYLKSPVSREYRLELFPDGRYGYLDRVGRKHTLSCGSTIEARIHDRYGSQCWVKYRIEHDGSDYYLRGYLDVPLGGLTIRRREAA